MSRRNSIIWASFFLYVAAMTPCHSQTREQTTVPTRRTVHVGATADAEFRTIQQAIDSAADNGLNILIAPGVYKEKVAIVQANISLIGTGREPSDTVITWGDSAKNTGSTFKSGTVTVTSDGFTAENLTIRNTWWDDHPNPDDASQAVALQLSSDRAVVDRVRLISGQDTLFAASLTCRSNTSNAPSDASRQLFNDCFIEGNVDYIFGDAKAVFNHCELNSRQHPTVVITAQSKHFPGENSGYFMLHCSITGTDDGNRVVLGRPWRDYSTVTFFDTDILPSDSADDAGPLGPVETGYVRHTAESHATHDNGAGTWDYGTVRQAQSSVVPETENSRSYGRDRRWANESRRSYWRWLSGSMRTSGPASIRISKAKKTTAPRRSWSFESIGSRAALHRRPRRVRHRSRRQRELLR